MHEDGQRRQCEAPTEEKLAAKLEKVEIRLEADAPNMRRPGADLIAHYLDPDRLPVQARWSRKHAHTQGRLCALYAAPVIGAVASPTRRTLPGATGPGPRDIVSPARLPSAEPPKRPTPAAKPQA